MVTVSTTRREGVLRRPTATTGFWSWFTTIDHKKIGILYGATALAFFLIGGVEALLIRAQLAGPDGTILNADQYNQIFTMHGVTMVFLFVMPMSAAFFNYFIPLMIGARDVAFPRLNAYSYWLFLLGGLFLYSSFFLGGAPNCGWFCYAPNSIFDPSVGPTFYALGLIITGIASTAGAVNLAVTVINMRAPGMSLFRVPVLRVDGTRGAAAPGVLAADHHRRAVPAALRPGVRNPLLRSDEGWGPDPVAAPVLAVRAPRGLHPRLARVRDRERDPAGLQPQAAVRLPVRRVLGDRDRVHRVRRVGAPHVRGGSGACGEHRLRRLDRDHRDPDRREDLQLDGDDVPRGHPFHLGDAVRDRDRHDVRDRRSLRRDARHRAVELPADGHLLHRRALPLRDLRRRRVRAVRWDVLLVAQGVRAVAERGLREAPFRS